MVEVVPLNVPPLVPCDNPVIKSLFQKPKLADWDHVKNIVLKGGRKWTSKSKFDENLRTILFCQKKNKGKDLVELWDLLEGKYGKCDASTGKRKNQGIDPNLKPSYKQLENLVTAEKKRSELNMARSNLNLDRVREEKRKSKLSSEQGIDLSLSFIAFYIYDMIMTLSHYLSSLI